MNLFLPPQATANALMLIASITSGVALSYPELGAGNLAFLPPFVLGAALYQARRRSQSLIAGGYGLLGWFVSAWWLSSGIQNMNPSYWWAGYLAVAALCIISAIPYFLFGSLCKHCHFFDRHNPQPLAAAALLSLIVELWPAKFPGSLANALYASTYFVQIAELGGVPLVHTVLHGIGFTLAAALSAPQAYRFRHLALSGALIVGTFGFGHYRISKFEHASNESGALSVAMIQPNIHLSQSTTNRGPQGTLESLAAQTRAAMDTSTPPDLVVWPEIPIYFSPYNNPEHRALIDDLSKGRTSALLVNADLFTNETINGRVPFYNSVQLFRGSGDIIGEYRKTILVPFGEYLPFEEYLTGPRFERVLSDLRRYTAAPAPSVIALSPSLTIGTPICLEAQHAELAFQMARMGAQALVTPSNDAYFGDSPGATLNLSFSIFRAIELRMPVVRVTNSGVTALIKASGEIQEDSRPAQFEPAVRTVSITPSNHPPSSISARSKGLLFLALITSVPLIRRIKGTGTLRNC